MRFENVGRTHVGRRRKLNEDAVLSRPGLWAVADGMGGHESGEIASTLAVSLLDAAAGRLALGERVAAAEAAIQDVNARLFEMAGGTGGRTIGTTIVAIAADANSFVCLWAGDSRAYRARGGHLAQLTHDHSLVQELVDAGELAPEAALHHPNANVITRAVGSEPALKLDRREGDILPGDTFLLASDGLTRLVSAAEILTGLQAKDIAAQADRFIETCLERGAPDNVSVVITRALA
ncbi:MAG TPA: protein phosphatase 2C domain-containing protein [Rhizomicrobium sp.]|nr:protein phosphatase 2C domain-containing protein [Rhizomicrobium sp.]